jgi:hypothetical protein
MCSLCPHKLRDDLLHIILARSAALLLRFFLCTAAVLEMEIGASDVREQGLPFGCFGGSFFLSLALQKVCASERAQW